MTYMISQRPTHEQIHRELKATKQTDLLTETITDMMYFCREVTMAHLDSLYEDRGRFSAPGRVVQIDEMKHGCRKYNRGRVISSGKMGILFDSTP